MSESPIKLREETSKELTGTSLGHNKTSLAINELGGQDKLSDLWAWEPQDKLSD